MSGGVSGRRRRVLEMSMRWLRIVLMIAAIPATARAQATQTPAPPVTAGWQDGFVLQTPNGDNRLVIGLNLQVDGRFPMGEGDSPPATFAIRKMRPTFSGRVAKYFDFRVMPDFGGGTAVLQDAYFDVRVSPRFRLRTGKDKTPVGYVVLLGDPYLLFPERSLASLLAPNRDIGFQAQGDFGPRFSYSGGVFNGIPDGVSSTTDDTNGAKDLAGRIVWRPFGSTSAPASASSGLGFHLGGSAGKQQGPLPSFRTLGGLTYFSYATGAIASGSRDRISPAVFYYHKSVGAYAEYTRSTQDVLRTGTTTTVANDGWEVTGSYVLTGEATSDRGVRPEHNLDPQNGHWGAFQIAARYSELHVDSEAFNKGLASASSNQHAKALTVGANWYLNTFIKYLATYERTEMDGGVGPRTENVIVVRAQLLF
jgi:phosphate-selective porin OprO and OprP